MEIDFDIIKKLPKPLPGEKGLALRSLQAKEGELASAVILASAYADIKRDAAAFSMALGVQISCRARGKSLELTCEGEGCAASLLDFLSSLGFSSEDTNLALEFYASRLKGDPLIRISGAESSLTDIRYSCIAEISTDQDPEEIYGYAFSLAEDYDMGIIKKR